jgi:antitoxin component YwqK of YwqJK toxin-antitoxin module
MRKCCVYFAIHVSIYSIVFFFLAIQVSAHAGAEGDSVFRSWCFTPSAVRGIVPLTKWSNREYIKISRTGPQEYIITNYNPAGIVFTTTHVNFVQGKISLVVEFNRWNQPVDSIWFRPIDKNEFYVTERRKGQNPNAPCLGLRFVFKDDLLQDIYCMRDSTKTGFNQEGVAHYVFERYNDAKRFSLAKSESFFGDIDNPVISRKSDCHRVVTVYDENGNLTTKTIYGLKDEQVTDRAGNSMIKMKYDKNDNETERAYFDSKGLPWNEYLGCAIRGNEYKKSFLEKQTFYRSDYTIARPHRAADFAAIVVEHHDESGNLIEKSFFDESELPINNSHGIHRLVSQYNSRGMITDLSCFDKKDMPTRDETGIHHLHLDYDANGQIISKSQFDVHGWAVVDPVESVYIAKYSYDGWGRVVASSCWRNDTLHMTSRLGYQEIHYQYDLAGMISQIEYVEGEKKVGKHALGYSRETLAYNPEGLIAERKYFKGDRPVSLQDTTQAVSGYTAIRYTYDFYNREYSLEYVDESGSPCNARLRLKTGMDLACQKIEFSYSAAQAVKETFFDKNNTPLGNADCEDENCILLTGNGMQIKKPVMIGGTKPLPAIFTRLSLSDSVFFSDQLFLLGKDSILIFLNEQGSRLAQMDCATFYRTVGINKYFQLQGQATDHYVDGDTLAARLSYMGGQLEGHAVYYYKNGKVKETGDYRDNHRWGSWNYYYENGMPYKTVLFSEKAMMLTEFYAENGDPLVRDGNGTYTGLLTLGKATNTGTYQVTGNVKNGLQEGEWTVSVKKNPNPLYVEKFSSGKFKKGTAYGFSGESNYSANPVSSFEGLHPQESVDQYGQNDFCTLRRGIRNTNDLFSIRGDFYPEIHQGMGKLLHTDQFKDYSGWVLLYAHFNSRGQLNSKSVTLYGENDRFKEELLKLLDQFGQQSTQGNEKAGTGFGKFYIVLVEGNQMAIPEELLANARAQQ